MTLEEQLEDTNMVIRIRKSKNGKYNDPKKKDKPTHKDVTILCRNLQIEQQPRMN